MGESCRLRLRLHENQIKLPLLLLLRIDWIIIRALSSLKLLFRLLSNNNFIHAQHNMDIMKMMMLSFQVCNIRCFIVM